MPNKLEEAGISWVIIGSQTKPYKPPKIEWVQEIVEATDRAGIPVFLKDNLIPLLWGKKEPFIKGHEDLCWLNKDTLKWELRQESPK
ncbi:hypothetical protein LCGC14_0420370 [marine sediment metagenome]|uniref:Uncharacterized protein n=1 Tax=marine sediment metagenome TaxID=412755 RepID=A0A0F9W078_9ZZZZ